MELHAEPGRRCRRDGLALHRIRAAEDREGGTRARGRRSGPQRDEALEQRHLRWNDLAGFLDALDDAVEPRVRIVEADDEGLYDVQRPELGAQRRARAVMRTDAEGRLRFRTVTPTAYPIPTDGPVGQMLVASGRHPWRPAHIHFLIRAPGFHTLTTHIFRDGDPYLDSDVVFGVRSSLIGRFERHAPGRAPDGSTMTLPFHTLDQEFVLAPQAAD